MLPTRILAMSRLSRRGAHPGKRACLLRVAITFAFALLETTHAWGLDNATQLRNWFDDPFFQASAQVPGCPEPRGPRLTEAEMQREAHARTERGTRCYLEGKCAKANAYQYDAGIADELRRRLDGARALRGTSVWITVERRWVWFQGCASANVHRRDLDAIARQVPEVERVFVEIGSKDRPPYPTLTAPAR